MKCDKLEKWYAGQCSPSCVVYGAKEVDVAIAELKSENERLKAKLENVQASAYADSVDAGMCERRMRRALWLARAERAKEMAKGYNAVVEWCSHSRWIEVERKCLKKAEEYR